MSNKDMYNANWEDNYGTILLNKEEQSVNPGEGTIIGGRWWNRGTYIIVQMENVGPTHVSRWNKSRDPHTSTKWEVIWLYYTHTVSAKYCRQQWGLLGGEGGMQNKAKH